MLHVFKKLKSFDQTASHNSALLRLLGAFICARASKRRLLAVNSGFFITYCVLSYIRNHLKSNKELYHI